MTLTAAAIDHLQAISVYLLPFLLVVGVFRWAWNQQRVDWSLLPMPMLLFRALATPNGREPVNIDALDD